MNEMYVFIDWKVMINGATTSGLKQFREMTGCNLLYLSCGVLIDSENCAQTQKSPLIVG